MSVHFGRNTHYFTKNPHEWMICNVEEDLPDYFQKLGDLILSSIIPTLEEYSDPKKVLDAYRLYDFKIKNNTDIIDWKGHASACIGLVLARLYGKEFYPELKEKYAPIFEPLLPKIKDKVVKLIQYLDQDTL